MKRRQAAWFVYMIECDGNRIYTGVAVDVAARFEKHCSGKGAAFTRINKPVRVLAAKKCRNRSAALKQEYALKQLRREQKVEWAGKWA
jgi:putative endonuclease